MSSLDPFSSRFEVFGREAYHVVPDVNGKAFAQLVDRLTPEPGADGRVILLKAPRAGYGKTLLIQRAASELAADHHFVKVSLVGGRTIEAAHVLECLLESLCQVLPAADGLTMLDLAARRIVARGLEPLVRSGEVPCQDRDGALQALQEVPVETFDFHHEAAVTAHWTEANFEILGPRLAAEMARVSGASLREAAYWVELLFRFATTSPENVERSRLLFETVFRPEGLRPAESGAGERLHGLLALMGIATRLVLVIDDTEGLSTHPPDALELASFLTNLAQTCPGTLVLLSVNHDVWETAFAPRLPGGLVDRLTEHEVRLRPLSREEAELVVRERGGADSSEVLERMNWDQGDLYARGVLKEAAIAWETWQEERRHDGPPAGDEARSDDTFGSLADLATLEKRSEAEEETGEMEEPGEQKADPEEKPTTTPSSLAAAAAALSAVGGEKAKATTEIVDREDAEGAESTGIADDEELADDTPEAVDEDWETDLDDDDQAVMEGTAGDDADAEPPAFEASSYATPLTPLTGDSPDSEDGEDSAIARLATPLEPLVEEPRDDDGMPSPGEEVDLGEAPSEEPSEEPSAGPSADTTSFTPVGPPAEEDGEGDGAPALDERDGTDATGDELADPFRDLDDPAEDQSGGDAAPVTVNEEESRSPFARLWETPTDGAPAAKEEREEGERPAVDEDAVQPVAERDPDDQTDEPTEPGDELKIPYPFEPSGPDANGGDQTEAPGDEEIASASPFVPFSPPAGEPKPTADQAPQSERPPSPFSPAVPPSDPAPPVGQSPFEPVAPGPASLSPFAPANPPGAKQAGPAADPPSDQHGPSSEDANPDGPADPFAGEQREEEEEIDLDSMPPPFTPVGQGGLPPKRATESPFAPRRDVSSSPAGDDPKPERSTPEPNPSASDSSPEPPPESGQEKPPSPFTAVRPSPFTPADGPPADSQDDEDKVDELLRQFKERYGRD